MRFSRLFLSIASAALLSSAMSQAPANADRPPARTPAMVIVTAASTAAAAAAVEDAGGVVDHVVPSARSVVADLLPSQVDGLEARGLVVTEDYEIEPSGADHRAGATRDLQLEAMFPAADWSLDAGAGVGVALIDTGVADVPDLAGRVVDGPDLSDDEDGLDRYGHGTFMAGLIAGDGTSSAAGPVRHTGVAPSAHIVSVKVAGADGSTSLVRLLVALDWVIAHRTEFDVRVVNLSFAAAPVDSWHRDPLALAAVAAADAGLTVVAASGNEGGRTASPAYAPGVIAVGALDHNGTVERGDDRRTAWSAQSPALAKPELVAPGLSTVSLRAAGSTIDVLNPGARVGDAYFRGSGTSMAAALTSGAAAVVAAGHPDSSAGSIRSALTLGADKVPSSVGAAVNLVRAADPSTATSAGLGRAVDVRTVVTVADPEWTGSWSGTRWAGTRWAGTRWAGTRWAGTEWAEAELAGTRWAGTRWAGTRWAGTRWAGVDWVTEPSA